MNRCSDREVRPDADCRLVDQEPFIQQSRTKLVSSGRCKTPLRSVLSADGNKTGTSRH